MLLVVLSAAGASPNVAMEATLCPLGVVDSGQTVSPRMAVLNSGDVSADSFWAHLTVDDEMDVVVYRDSAMMRGLEPGDSDTVKLAPWVPVGRDSMGASAWTWWDEDSVPEDDTLVQRFLVRVKDVAITAVNNPLPGDTIDRGLVYPQVELFNYGNQTMTFPMIFNIGPYFDTVWVNNLLAGGSRSVTATRPWTAAAGVWLCNQRAQVCVDLHPENNDSSFVFYVRGTISKDMAVDEILVPIGVIDTTPFCPRVRIANYGSSGDTYWLFLWIDDSAGNTVYRDSVQVFPDSTRRPFKPCTLRVPGPYVVSCSLHLEGDRNWLNNALHQNFRVGTKFEHDVGVEAILIPAIVDSGAVVSPRVVVGNYGQWPETFPVCFLLPCGYLDSVNITELGIGMYDTVLFSNWEAVFPPGCTVAVAWTLLEGDENPSNDTMVKPFTIRKRDIGLSAIFSPKDTVLDSTVIGPACEVTNYGNTVETFQVLFRIGPFEARETVIGLVGGNSRAVVFSDSWPSLPGVWVARAQVIPDPWPDTNTSNDVMCDTFWVPGRIRHDVGIGEITSPVGVHDTIGTLDVTAIVRNYGENTETFWTYFSIFNEANTRVYCDSVQTESLLPGRSAELTFRQADIIVPGWYTARCSTYLANDQNWTNNLVTEMFRIETAGGLEESQSLPMAFGLDPIRPNPFRAKAAARFMLPEPSRVDLAVYSSDGRRVRILACGRIGAGRYEVVWDGCGEAGRPVARNVYYLRFVAGDCVLQKKLVKTE